MLEIHPAPRGAPVHGPRRLATVRARPDAHAGRGGGAAAQIVEVSARPWATPVVLSDLVSALDAVLGLRANYCRTTADPPGCRVTLPGLHHGPERRRRGLNGAAGRMRPGPAACRIPNQETIDMDDSTPWPIREAERL